MAYDLWREVMMTAQNPLAQNFNDLNQYRYQSHKLIFEHEWVDLVLRVSRLEQKMVEKVVSFVDPGNA